MGRHLIESGKASVEFRRSFQQRDGSALQARLSMSLLRDPAGRPEGLLCVAQDITALLKIDANERARVEAEMANRAKSEFPLAHEP